MTRFKKWINKIGIVEIIFLFTIILGFLFRLSYYSNDPKYIYEGDYNRDYLVAHHMLKYHEVPLKGPDGGLGVVSSPLYYYLLYLALLVNDSLLTLGIFNIFLQIGSILLVYLLCLQVFSKSTAFIASFLFNFQNNLIEQSQFVWQPAIMQPFNILAYFLAILSYEKKSFKLLVGSIIAFNIALSIHYSLIGILPLYFFIIFLIVYRVFKYKKYYLIIFVATFLSLVLTHIPLLILWWGNITGFFTEASYYIPRPDFTYILDNFVSRTKIFFGYFFDTQSKQMSMFLFFSYSVLVIHYFIDKCVDLKRKSVAKIIFSGMGLFLLITSLKPDIGFGIPFPTRYFAPIFIPLIILIAEVTNPFRKDILVTKVLKIITLTFTVNIFLSKIPDLYRQTRLRFPTNIVRPEMTAIKGEIEAIKQNENKSDYSFFIFKVYKYIYERGISEDLYQSEIFWVGAEKVLDARLTYVDDLEMRGWKPNASDEYIFLVCPKLENDTDSNSDCFSSFLKDHAKYNKVKTVALSNLNSIYLFKRK